jgi:competence protein ComFA
MMEGGMCAKEEWKASVAHHVSPQLEFALTDAQARASGQVLEYLKQGHDVFCYAAAGAGKTEMTMESIAYMLGQGKSVGFAISRRQVVLEIRERLAKAFPALKVIAVCQGHTKVTKGDLIVCTTHQLYRYPGAFDLLVLDELDAFPYAGNALLEGLARKACRGQMLLLSATPDAASQRAMEEGRMKGVCLFARPHGKALPVPKCIVAPRFVQVGLIKRKIKKYGDKQVLVFVPKRSQVGMMAWWLRGKGIHSQSRDKDEVLQAFRERKFQVLVSTTLLERGITIPSVQVIVFEGNHSVFTTASLIQIFGRAGRSFSDPEGECTCYQSKRSRSVSECVKQLVWMNRSV